MSFGKNLQFLRKMHNSMTQEDLSELLLSPHFFMPVCDKQLAVRHNL